MEYLGIGFQAADAIWIFRFVEEGIGDSAVITDEEKRHLAKAIKSMFELCKNVGLTVSSGLLRDRLEDLPVTKRELDLLIDVVRAELRDKLLLFVPPDHAKYYDLILPSIITIAFPNASKEIVAAGNCFATELYTACVFHSMRAAEIGVRALGATIGVSFPDKPLELAEWQNILDQADSIIGKMKDLKPRIHKDED